MKIIFPFDVTYIILPSDPSILIVAPPFTYPSLVVFIAIPFAFFVGPLVDFSELSLADFLCFMLVSSLRDFKFSNYFNF